MASSQATKKGPKSAIRIRATADFIAAYLNLCEDLREYVEQYLALQVSEVEVNGMAPYTPGQRADTLTGDGHDSLCCWVGPEIHEAWSRWAKMIRNAKLKEFERRAAVREMLGALISHMNIRQLGDDELLAAADRALAWTVWDAYNRKLARLRKQPEFLSCMEEISKRGENAKEASRRLWAMSPKQPEVM